MRTRDGREVLVRLAYPLPLNIVPELLRAVGVAAEAAGYTDVALETDEVDPGAISGLPPAASCPCGGTGEQCDEHMEVDIRA